MRMCVFRVGYYHLFWPSLRGFLSHETVLKLERNPASQGEPVTLVVGSGPSKHKGSEEGAHSLAPSEREEANVAGRG